MKLDEKIEKLNSIGIALSSIREIDVLLDMIVSKARELTRADAGSLYLREGEELSFRIAQNDTLEKRLGSRENFFKPFKLRISKKNIAGYVTLTSKPLNLKDAYLLKHEEYEHSKEFDEKFDYRTVSILTVPMIDHKDNVIGVLQLINAKDRTEKIIPFPIEFETMVMSIASQAAVAINNARFIEEIKDLFKAVVQYSASAIDARSPHTAGHSERVSNLATKFAMAVSDDEKHAPDIRFTAYDLEEIRYAGWLHDIGKIGVKEIVLDKRNKLSDENIEYLTYKFFTLILQKRLELLEEKIDSLQKKPADASSLAEDEYQKEREKIINDMEFVKRINIPKERMTEEDLKRLKELVNVTFENPVSGKAESIISDLEYENLSIIRGSLNEAERQEAQSHVVKSIKIIEKIPFRGYLKNIPDIVAKHHEYLDGSGYPYKVKADEITVQSRILCICDIFDALAARDRPYKPALPLDTVLNILRKDAQAGKLDIKLVELFIEKRVWEGLYQF